MFSQLIIRLKRGNEIGIIIMTISNMSEVDYGIYKNYSKKLNEWTIEALQKNCTWKEFLLEKL